MRAETRICGWYWLRLSKVYVISSHNLVGIVCNSYCTFHCELRFRSRQPAQQPGGIHAHQVHWRPIVELTETNSAAYTSAKLGELGAAICCVGDDPMATLGYRAMVNHMCRKRGTQKDQALGCMTRSSGRDGPSSRIGQVCLVSFSIKLIAEKQRSPPQQESVARSSARL